MLILCNLTFEAIAGNAMSSAFQRTAETRDLLSKKFEWLTTNFTVLSTLDTAQYQIRWTIKLVGLKLSLYLIVKRVK